MTLALEWPDLEAEEKAKAKRKKTQGFIVTTDSDDEPRQKKKKTHERKHLDSFFLLYYTDWKHRWTIVPCKGKFNNVT
jgi:hypothetical protein